MHPNFVLLAIKQVIISAGLRKAKIVLGYTNSTPSFALLCPCGEGDPHPATIRDGGWICSLDEDYGKKFTPNQQLWLNEQPLASINAYDINLTKILI